jgi:hypothetical protein
MADITLGRRRTLLVLTTLAMLALPTASRAVDVNSDEAMIAEFKSFCSDYYSREQCDNALRFVINTYGSDYFAQLHYEEAPSRFAEMLSDAVKGGETLKASEMASAGTGD